METSDFDFENIFSIFQDSFLKNINKEENYEILVAYSGGIDSTALLYLADKFAKQEKINISGSACQPNQAPKAANNLKSPWPIPSLPVSNLNSQ